MWVVLIDHSDSMGGPFEGGDVFPGKKIRSKKENRLDAAKESIKTRILGLDPNERIILIGFTSTARVIFEGTVSEQKAINEALDMLEATNGTSIAAAMDCAFGSLSSIGGISRVLIVSDCETDLEKAEQSSRKLSRLALIDVLLIDPKEETEKIARAIIHQGEVQAVTGPEELTEAVTKSDKAAMQVAGAIEHAKQSAADAAKIARKATFKRLKETQPEVHPAEFAAGHPTAVQPKIWHNLYVSIYATNMRDKAAKWLSEKLSADGVAAHIEAVQADTLLSRGARLRIEPTIPGTKTNPQSIDVIWENLIEYRKFRFLVDESFLNEKILGSINVYYGPARISAIPVEFEVTSDSSSDKRITSVAETFGSVFCAYAREDVDIVDQSRAIYEALGINVFQDTDSLRKKAGADWRRAILNLIDDSDAFQLYWSYFSSISEEVEREWRYALKEISDKNKDYRFLRPVCWSDRVPPLPPELEARQMSWIPAQGVQQPAEAGFEKISVVIPLIPIPNEQRQIIEVNSGVAIKYIEQTTGLVYQPPIILSVDDWAIRQITSSEPNLDLFELATDLWAFSETLTALTLNLHVGFNAQDTNGKYKPTYQATGDHRHIINGLAEYIIRHITHLVLELGGFSSRNHWGAWDGPPKPIEQLVESLNDPAYSRSTQSKYINTNKEFYAEPENKNMQLPSWRDTLVKFGKGAGINDPDECPTILLLERLLKCFLVGYHETVDHLGKDWVLHLGVSLDPIAIHRLGSHVALSKFDLSERKAMFDSDPVRIQISGKIDDIVELFEELASIYISNLKRFYALINSQTVEFIDMRTYGVYLPGNHINDRALMEWAVDRDIRAELTLPGTPKILLCLDAMARRTANISDNVIRERLLISLMIHEHFHAAVDARSEFRIVPEEYLKETRALEEALAVWLELDAAREIPDLMLNIRSYAESGEYPHWPYAGALSIEQMYEQSGQSAVKRLIDRFLSKPAEAVDRFQRLLSKYQEAS